MKFIVTGGFGYIGSHMCKFLHEKNHEVIVIDEVEPTHSYFDDHILSNIGNPDIPSQLKKIKGIDGVFNFAADSIVSESEKDPMKFYINNVNETIFFLDAVIEANIKIFIQSSTAAVYGDKQASYHETDALCPINTYGRTKKMVEQILEDLASKKLIKTGILRYFNVAGNCPFNTIGENHDPETHIIPKIIKEVLEGKDKVYIYGRNYNTTDGTCIRDYIHVEDLIRAHWLVFHRLIATKDSKIEKFNVGSGKGYTNLQVVNTIKEVTKKDFEIVFAEKRQGDPDCLVAETDKIYFTMQFKPKYNLKEMIQHTFNYQSEKLNENTDHGFQ